MSLNVFLVVGPSGARKITKITEESVIAVVFKHKMETNFVMFIKLLFTKLTDVGF